MLLACQVYDWIYINVPPPPPTPAERKAKLRLWRKYILRVEEGIWRSMPRNFLLRPKSDESKKQKITWLSSNLFSLYGFGFSWLGPPPTVLGWDISLCTIDANPAFISFMLFICRCPCGCSCCRACSSRSSSTSVTSSFRSRPGSCSAARCDAEPHEIFTL